MPETDVFTTQRVNACKAEVRNQLRKLAEDSIFYVVLGECIRREMADNFGLPESQVHGILSVQACKLVDEIRGLS